MPINHAVKRITRIDMKGISKLDGLGIYVDFNEENVTEAVAMIIGPDGGAYKNGVLLFKIKFPDDYPFSPPKVSYVSRGSIRIHPNLYTGGAKDNYLGKVCLSILGTWSGPPWSPAFDISTILITIQSLLDDNPLENEPGFTGKSSPNHEKYKECVNYETIRTLIHKNIFDIPTEFMCFKDVIHEHYNLKRDEILSTITKKCDESSGEFKRMILHLYRINITMNYPYFRKLITDKERFG